MKKMTEKEKLNALNEIRLLASVDHPNVISYKEAYIDEPSESLCIIMEYAEGGDLLTIINKQSRMKKYLSENIIWSYTAQMIKGLKALHDLLILHRDLKCANVFQTNSGLIKLGDLNVSKIAKQGMLRTQTGTPYYASPEVWKDQPYSLKSDIWSLGCVIYELASLKPPFRSVDMKSLYKIVIAGKYDNIPSHFSTDLSNLIKQCLQVNPKQRPSTSEMLSNNNTIINTIKGMNFYQKVQKNDLLETIKMPRNLKKLNDILPKAKYGEKILEPQRGYSQGRKDYNPRQSILKNEDIRNQHRIALKPINRNNSFDPHQNYEENNLPPIKGLYEGKEYININIEKYISKKINGGKENRPPSCGRQIIYKSKNYL